MMIGVKTTAMTVATASILAVSTATGETGAVTTRSCASSPEMASQAEAAGELAGGHHQHRNDDDIGAGASGHS